MISVANPIAKAPITAKAYLVAESTTAPSNKNKTQRALSDEAACAAAAAAAAGHKTWIYVLF